MRATVCAFTLSIALVGVVPSAARTAAAPRPTIVFSTTRTPNWWAVDLFVVDASGRPRNTTTTPGVSEFDPDWSPTGAELAFSRERSGNADVYVRDATGAVRRLTTAPETDTSPVWSPRGERIAFVRSADNRQVLWVMNRDGSGQRPISTASTEILSPSWSPDGSRIAYLDGRRVAVAEVAGGEARIVSERRVTLALVWRRDGRIVVVLRGPNGALRLQSLGPDGEAVRDEPNPCGNEFPKWSSDRRHVLCMPWWFPPTARVVGADGAEVMHLRLAPRNQSVHFRGFSLSAGGDRVAFGALVREKDADLATMAPGSPPRVRLVHPDEDIDPALSPDGTRIAFVRASYQTHDGEGALLLFEPASRRVRRLPARGADPSWSPDGRRLVFSRTGNLYRLSVTSGRATLLTRGRLVDVDPAWSPDGRRIAFVRYGRRGSLLVLDLATGRTRTLFTGPPELRDPAWSPRGDTIAFATTESLLTIRAAGGVARTVFRDEDNPISAPVWSPDGRRILFTKGWTLNIPYDSQVPRAHFLALYVVAAAGRTAPVLLTRGPGWEFGADWRR